LYRISALPLSGETASISAMVGWNRFFALDLPGRCWQLGWRSVGTFLLLGLAALAGTGPLALAQDTVEGKLTLPVEARVVLSYFTVREQLVRLDCSRKACAFHPDCFSCTRSSQFP
jgi:hypothetical protein